ncbi:DUF2207 domain-containing protein [Candidatus Palauibacter irciniicola]|uniref:DUF2207 domain-containing protein n=1 Tax=Candidatus Palauibacter irciniicola TaxID=3056733 RepID=UPI003B0169AF
MKLRRPRRAAEAAARAAVLAGATAGVLCLFLSPAAAQERSWRIEEFHADIRVLESGAIEVTETIRPRFNGSYNGIYRTIRVEDRINGFRRKLRLSVEAVTDADGNPLRYETERDGDYLNTKIWVPGAVDTVRTVRLSYGVTNGLRFFEADEGEDGIVDAYDELYWNVTGTEWPVPIETASATVRLPQAVGGVRAHAFTGGYGATGRDATVDVTGTRVDVRTDRPLGFREGLTIGIGWNAGAVRRPTAMDRAGMYLSDNWPLFLPFFVLAFMYRRWNERGRDPEIGSIEPRYEPPGDLTPAEVGVIVDNRADLRDITATLIDLAVRGHLTIEEREEKDYTFERRDNAGDRLAPHESALLRAVFGGRRTRRLSDLKDRFYKDLPELKSKLLATLIEHGVYTESPTIVAGKYVGLGFLVGIVIFFGGLLAQAVLPLAMGAVLGAAIASAFVIVVFGLFMPARTKKGTELLRQVKGFEEFLTRVESDRYRRKISGPEMFEECLPYAMALGVAGQWARAFRDLYREPPDWYHGHALSTFNSHILVSNLNTMSAETHSVMQSAPRSAQASSFSGGGISGGGGFSGGGFGGGGGGAF